MGQDECMKECDPANEKMKHFEEEVSISLCHGNEDFDEVDKIGNKQKIHYYLLNDLGSRLKSPEAECITASRNYSSLVESYFGVRKRAVVLKVTSGKQEASGWNFRDLESLKHVVGKNETAVLGLCFVAGVN